MELIETRGPQEATEAARQASSGEVDVVVVVGGDGRVMEAAGGLINRRLPLAIIPAGTQPVISEYEHTSDPRLSTLQRYVAALGGHLRVLVEFDHDIVERQSQTSGSET